MTKATVRRQSIVLCTLVLLFFACGSVSGIETAILQAPFPTGAVKEPPQSTPPATPSTNEVLIYLAPGTDAAAYAQEHGLVLLHVLQSNSDMRVFEAASTAAAEALVQNSASDARVQSAYLNTASQVAASAFTPNDTYFPMDTPVAGWLGQWHLVNQHVTGRDLNVQGAWNNDITGTGVTIGIVDDGLDTTHEDLSGNYVSADSWDFAGGDSDPSPTGSNNHGTAVAGLAAAEGGNNQGVTGVAPNGGLAGLRVSFGSGTVSQFVDATLYHSSGSNTNIRVKNHSYGIQSPFIPAQAEVDALVTSTDCGTIHVTSAGNQNGDANKRHFESSPASIVVAALSSDDNYASYSNFGANVFCTVYSDSHSTPSQFSGITTTDRTGAAGYNPPDSFPDMNYTTVFGGTSAASPQVAGVMALGVQVQPALNARFAKHLLVRTSDVIDPSDSTYWSDGGWQTNAAGNRFNQNYGFGRVDADEFTAQAVLFLGVTDLTTHTTQRDVNFAIPDDNLVLQGFTFDVSATTPLEEVLLYVDITHTYRGDLELFVRSPSGTLGRMGMYDGDDDEEDMDWTFTSNLFWGEDPEGEWGVYVRDVLALDTGTWNSFTLQLRMGELVPIPEPGTVTLFTIVTGGLVLIRRLRRRRSRK